MHELEARDASKESRLRQEDSGLLDCALAIDILSIEFVELLLLVSDCCCSASIMIL